MLDRYVRFIYCVFILTINACGAVSSFQHLTDDGFKNVLGNAVMFLAFTVFSIPVMVWLVSEIIWMVQERLKYIAQREHEYANRKPDRFF